MLPLFQSEILGKKEIAALDGKPFWMIRKRRWGSDEYDYDVTYVTNYLYHNYPIIDISVIAPNYFGSDQYKNFTIKQNISLALTRQWNDLNEDSWAVGSKDDFARALTLLKLKGFSVNPKVEHKGSTV